MSVVGLSDAEKELVRQNYYDAYNVYMSKKITEQYISEKFGVSNDKDDMQINAYRHAMWSAAMTDKMGEEKAKKFGDAHEQRLDNPADSMKMDLHNNALGRRIAIEYAGQGYDVFSKKIIDEIINGEAEVIIWDPCVK